MLPFEDVSRSPWVLCHSCLIPLMFVQETWIGEENNRNKRLSIAVKRLVWQQGETEYVKRRKWLFMHTWRYSHLMRTTNPIESYMSSLCRRMSGLGCAREANLFNHYRILVTWMILRMKRREVLSGGKAVVPLVEGGRTDGTWIVRQVIRRAHHVQCYKGWLGWGWWVVGNWMLAIGMKGCTRWGTVHMTGNIRWISPIPAHVTEVTGRRHPVFMWFSTLTTWSNGGKCGIMWVMINPNPRYNSGCADSQ